MKITHIASVASGDTDITVTARVMNMSSLEGDFHEFSFLECQDHTGAIRILCSDFGDKMKEVVTNGIYTFTKLEAKKVAKGDRDGYRHHIRPDYDLVITSESEIWKQPETPHRTYNFTQIKELKERISQNPCERDLGMYDAIGMCTKIEEPAFEPMNAWVSKLTLVDESTGLEDGFTLAVCGRTCGRETGPDGPPEEVQNLRSIIPFVVVAKNGRLKTFDGGRTNSGITNMVLIPKLCKLPNPLLIQREHELEKWYDEAKKERENAAKEDKLAPKRERDVDDSEEPGRAQKRIKEGKD